MWRILRALGVAEIVLHDCMLLMSHASSRRWGVIKQRCMIYVDKLHGSQECCNSKHAATLHVADVSVLCPAGGVWQGRGA